MAASKQKRTSSGRDSIRGVIRANGGWMFVVQAFGIHSESTPRLCKLASLDQLRGNSRKMAERWVRYLDAPHGPAEGSP